MSENESVRVSIPVTPANDVMPIYRVTLVREPTGLESSRTAVRKSSEAAELLRPLFTDLVMPGAGEAATTTNKQGGSNEGNRTPATRSKGTLATDRRCRYDAELYSQVIDQEAMETVVAKKDRLALAQAGD